MLKEIRPAIVLHRSPSRSSPASSIRSAMTGIAGVIFPYQAQGSLIEKDGKVIGSALIGQLFTERPLFPWPASATLGARPRRSDQDGRRRPTTPPIPAGSNLGPTSKALIERVKADVDKLKQENLAAGSRSTW